MAMTPEATRSALTGISGILVTPMDAEDRIRPERLAPIIAPCATAGVDALTVNGNTRGGSVSRYSVSVPITGSPAG